MKRHHCDRIYADANCMTYATTGSCLCTACKNGFLCSNSICTINRSFYVRVMLFTQLILHSSPANSISRIMSSQPTNRRRPGPGYHHHLSDGPNRNSNMRHFCFVKLQHLAYQCPRHYMATVHQCHCEGQCEHVPLDRMQRANHI